MGSIQLCISIKLVKIGLFIILDSIKINLLINCTKKAEPFTKTGILTNFDQFAISEF